MEKLGNCHVCGAPLDEYNHGEFCYYCGRVQDKFGLHNEIYPIIQTALTPIPRECFYRSPCSDESRENVVIHELKISPEYFKDVVSGVKTFEIRKNDRDFKVGDCIKLNEYTAEDGYTGESRTFEITYVMTDAEYVKEGFAVLGIRRCFPFRRIIEKIQEQCT